MGYLHAPAKSWEVLGKVYIFNTASEYGKREEKGEIAFRLVRP